MLHYPFTGIVAGLASLNVNLLLAARRVTSLFALALAASLAPVLGWLFGPAMELLSNGEYFPCIPTEASVTLISCFFTLTMRQVTSAPLGITAFPSPYIRAGPLMAKG